MGPATPLLSSALGLAAALALGCAATEARREPGSYALPFTARLSVVKVPEAPEADASSDEPVLPPLFEGGKEDLERALAAALNRSDTFLRVVTGGDSDSIVDLDLEVSVSGANFKAGRVKPSGAVFSTLAWLFTGHLSWFIDDRYYPDSTVNIHTAVRQAESAAGRDSGGSSPIYEVDIPLNGLELSFIERADPARWFLNILVPPWCGEGNPKVVGSSLTKRSVERFAREEPNMIARSLPGSYFRATSSFVVYSKDGHELVVITRRGLNELTVLSTTGSERPVGVDELALKEVLPVAAREQLRAAVADRLGGIGVDNHFYRIPLKPQERGELRVKASLEGGGTGGPWTIYAPPS